MTEASIHNTKLNDIANLGIRSAIGVIFILHGSGKLNPGFGGFVTGKLGFPPEMQIPIAIAEIIPGILLVVGVFTRISASLLAIIMLGAIFYVKKATSLTGEGGAEFEVILLAGALLIIATGPGRASLAHIIKKLPRCIH